MDTQKEIKEINLVRGKAGLGFNIRGGTDMQHVKGNNGIFVTKIRDKGAAAEDGQLREGDQIVEINGTNVLEVTHTTAVNLFLTSGDSVKLLVIPEEERRIKAILAAEEKARLQKKMAKKRGLSSIEDGGSSSLYKFTMVVLGLGIVAGGAFVTYKYMKQKGVLTS